MLAALALVSAAAVAVSAAPALNARQTNVAACDNLGPGAFDVANNFTLAAWNEQSTNSSGVPLVLGQAGAIDGASFKVLSTWASYPFNQWPSLTLSNGGLVGNFEREGVNPAIGGSVSSGSFPGFIVSTEAGAPAPIYCGVASTDPAHGGYPQLAVNGSPDLFSLCPTSGTQVNIVYNATADNFGTYKFEECTPVKLHMLGLY